MNVTPEELAAFADGELDEARTRMVAAEVARSPELQAQVSAHRALKDRLAAHFAPIAEQPVPDRLARLLKNPPAAGGKAGNVIDLTATRRPPAPVARPRLWRYAGPALAASLVLALVGIGLRPTGDLADRGLAQVLDTQLASSQTGDATVRILLSFRDREGSLCRGYADRTASGIACRTADGWKVVRRFGGAPTAPGEYRQADSPAGQVFAAAQEMTSGPALDDTEERAARAAGWNKR